MVESKRKRECRLRLVEFVGPVDIRVFNLAYEFFRKRFPERFKRLLESDLDYGYFIEWYERFASGMRKALSSADSKSAKIIKKMLEKEGL